MSIGNLSTTPRHTLQWDSGECEGKGQRLWEEGGHAKGEVDGNTYGNGDHVKVRFHAGSSYNLYQHIRICFVGQE